MTLKEEKEANEFALCLLMPEDFIKQELKKLLNGKKVVSKRFQDIKNISESYIVDKMAEKFKVPEAAMRTRLYNLGYITVL